MDRKKLDNLTQQFSLIQENDNYNEICETFEKNIKHFVIQITLTILIKSSHQLNIIPVNLFFNDCKFPH